MLDGADTCCQTLKGQVGVGLPTQPSGSKEATKPSLSGLMSATLCYLTVTPGSEPIGTWRELWKIYHISSSLTYRGRWNNPCSIQQLGPEVLWAAPSSESALESSRRTEIGGAHRALRENQVTQVL